MTFIDVIETNSRRVRAMFGKTEENEDDPQLVDLTPEELQLPPLMGADPEQARASTEQAVAKLTQRRDAIDSEIERLKQEKNKTELVLRSREAALSILARPASLPSVAA